MVGHMPICPILTLRKLLVCEILFWHVLAKYSSVEISFLFVCFVIQVQPHVSHHVSRIKTAFFFRRKILD